MFSRSAGKRAAGIVANLDLVILVLTLVADIRLYQGNPVASFTLLELFILLYCAPVVASFLFLQRRRSLPPQNLYFLTPLYLYIGWITVASAFAIAFRGNLEILQDAKNIVPMVVLVLFIFIRVTDTFQVSLICNLYIVYAVMTCLLGLVQYKYSAPYYRELLRGTEYKLGIEGEFVDNPVVGFSNHPNAFAVTLIPGICLAMSKLWSEIRSGCRIRLVTVAITILLGIGLVLSQARGALIFSVTAVGFMVLPLRKRGRFLPRLTVVAAVTAAIVIYGHIGSEEAEAGASTIETRFRLWQLSFKSVFSDAYVLFFGDGTKFVLRWSEQFAGWEFTDAHNVWIDQILFFGFPAFAFYLMIWQRFFHVADASRRGLSPLAGALLDGIAATVMALMGDFFFEPFAVTSLPLSLLFLFLPLGIQAMVGCSPHAADRVQNTLAHRAIGSVRIS